MDQRILTHVQKEITAIETQIQKLEAELEKKKEAKIELMKEQGGYFFTIVVISYEDKNTYIAGCYTTKEKAEEKLKEYSTGKWYSQVISVMDYDKASQWCLNMLE